MSFEPAWGDIPCSLCIQHPAECTFEDEYLCIGCADICVDRAFALSINPTLTRSLASLRAVVGRNDPTFRPKLVPQLKCSTCLKEWSECKCPFLPV